MFTRSESARAGLYRRLQAMESAGIPLQRSLHEIAGQGGSGAGVARDVEAAIERGEDAAEAFSHATGVTPLEAKVVGAGAKAGTLPAAFGQLADHFDDRAKVKWAVIVELAYPVFLLHAAVVLPAVPTLFGDAGLSGFLWAVGTPLGIAYAVVLGSYFGYKALRQSSPRSADQVLLGIPLVGRLVRKRALTAGLGVFRILYTNGVRILEALDSAATACPNAVVGAMFARIRDRVTEGSPIAAAFSMERSVPPIVLEMVTTGEATGKLDETLAQAEAVLEMEAKQARTAMIVGAGIVAFATAAIVIAYKVITFYSNLYGDLLK